MTLTYTIHAGTSCVLKVEALKGNIEVYWSETDPRNDGYMLPFHQHIENGNGDDEWIKDGFFAVFDRRPCEEFDTVLSNSNNDLPRRVAVRVLGEDEISTAEARMKRLKNIQTFLTDPTRNIYNHKYIIDNRSDTTTSESLSCLDAYLYMKDIFTVLKAVYWHSNDRGTSVQQLSVCTTSSHEHRTASPKKTTLHFSSPSSESTWSETTSDSSDGNVSLWGSETSSDSDTTQLQSDSSTYDSMSSSFTESTDSFIATDDDIFDSFAMCHSMSSDEDTSI